MKFIKSMCIVSLGLFILGANSFVKAVGGAKEVKYEDVECKNVEYMIEAEEFGPYTKYIRIDKFTTFILSDVPDDKIQQVREWIQTDEGRKQGFHKENGGRDCGYYACQHLADKAYNILGDRYNIPQDLRPYFIISEGWYKIYDCYFDSLMPENLKAQAKSVLPRIKAKFHAEEKKITDWMIKCFKANKIFPIEPTT